jgi:hypothetical protein
MASVGSSGAKDLFIRYHGRVGDILIFSACRRTAEVGQKTKNQPYMKSRNGAQKDSLCSFANITEEPRLQHNN